MRPPLLVRALSLRVATTLLLLMTSSVIATDPSPITVENGCLPADKATGACSDYIEGTPNSAGDKTITCSPGFILESTILEGDILKGVAKLKATCYPKCKFMKLKCPLGVGDCMDAVYATPQINCAATHDLYFNYKAVKSFAKCDNVAGWTDELNNALLAFTTTSPEPDVNAFCLKKKPPPPPPQTFTRCDASSFEVDCTGIGCGSPTFNANAKKLSCQAGQKLAILDSMLFDHAMCTTTGWEGHATVSGGTGGTKLLAFTAHPTAALPYPDPKLRAHCYTLDCAKLFACPLSTPTCAKPVLNQNKLACAAGLFLTIAGAIYKEALCSADGWKANAKDLIKYSPASLPATKLEAQCQKDCSSLFENDCPEGVCKVAPALDPATKTKISCPLNNILIVNGKDYKELACSTAGWATSEAPPKTILDYSSGIKQLKARCLSRCHRHFVDTTCAVAGCNQPIYFNEGEPMFCRDGEQLVLNGKEVSDVVCDIAAGWKDGGNVVPFNETTNIVKAECKPKPTTTTTTTTLAPAESQEKAGNDMPYIVIIILLIGIILVGTSFFCWHMKKRKKTSRDDDEENPSRTKTDSKNKSKKGKKGKKSKKGEGKSEKKKGKKTKKEKSKKEMEVDSDVEVPVQQMSMPNDSTLPLTLAARAPSGTSPNVMDI